MPHSNAAFSHAAFPTNAAFPANIIYFRLMPHCDSAFPDITYAPDAAFLSNAAFRRHIPLKPHSWLTPHSASHAFWHVRANNLYSLSCGSTSKCRGTLHVEEGQRVCFSSPPGKLHTRQLHARPSKLETRASCTRTRQNWRPWSETRRKRLQRAQPAGTRPKASRALAGSTAARRTDWPTSPSFCSSS